MRRMRVFLAVMGLGTALAGPARAQVSMTGLSGYFNTPSAEVLRDGTLEIGYNVFARQWSYDHRGIYSNNAYFATLGFLPRVEVMVRVTALPGYISYTESDSLSNLTDADRMWAGKIQVVQGSRWIPDVALGLEDPLGTRRFHAVYLVAGRRFRFAGMGARVDGGVTARLLRRVSNYTLSGGFGAFELRPAKFVALLAEYDTEKWNVGLKLSAPPGLTARLVWLNARTFTGGLGLTAHL